MTGASFTLIRVSDNPFLFYSGDPATSHYVALWSGGAKRDEANEIEAWTLKNARGIPKELASCFAWYVTNNHNR